MGVFGDDDGQSDQQKLLNEENDQKKAEIEAERKSLYQERLDILKSNSGTTWNENSPTDLIPQKPTSQDMVGFNNVSDILTGDKP